jgi:hypothetical protein
VAAAWNADAAAGAEAALPGRGVLTARLLTALVQALGLYLLAEAASAPRAWPATQALAFDPLFLFFLFVPVLVLVGLGRMHARALALWAVVAGVLVLGLGWFDAARERVPAIFAGETFWPSLHLWLALVPSLFVAHVLVVDAISQRRLVAPYPRHFDTAWKLGVQLALAVAFIGVFWGVLALGAGLFKLVDVDFFQRLIRKRWFAFPATTLALALAIHVTDVQPALIRGARALALTLLSWLLPLLAVVLAGFLGSLPFLSLAPLWKTHFATGLLLTAVALLVILINSCYQDGAAEQTRSALKRRLASLGALELVALVALAAWALGLRVAQYGWTGQRIVAAAIIVLAACYAIGYAVAAVRSPLWLQQVETTNFAAAYLALALVLALFTPLADPARLMVADQLARLRSGAVSAKEFDFMALKFDGARWGAAALAELARGGSSADAGDIAARAKTAIDTQNRYWVSPAARADHIDVYPEGRTLPPHLLEDVFDKAGLALPCCCQGAGRCTVRYIHLTPERESILFLGTMGHGYILESPDGQRWQVVANVNRSGPCSATDSGNATYPVQAVPHPWPDLQIGGHHYVLNPYSKDGC